MGGRNGGRKRLPTAVKAARGTLQPCRTPKEEPRIVPAIPPVPPDLDEDEAAAFATWADAALDLGIVCVHDGPGLRELACADVRVVRARAAVRKAGISVVNDKGAESMSPEWREREAALADFSRRLAQFGMTPSDRSRVKAAPKAPAEKTEREKAKERFFG